MRVPGIDAETILNFMIMLLRGAAYLFAGFSLLGLSTYLTFVCWDSCRSKTRPKVRITKASQPAGCVQGARQHEHLLPAETPDSRPERANRPPSPSAIVVARIGR